MVNVVDEQWWKEHGKAVKTKLTKAEGFVGGMPQAALRVAEEVEALMEEHGYPDWWHRVQRLHQDAALRADWRWG
jgi:hypothetical protein